MVKTDGGSNMVANTFEINIPGWTQESEAATQEESLSAMEFNDRLNEPSTVNAAKPTSPTTTTGDEMVELEIDCNEENEPLWSILKEMGVDVLEQAATLDEEDTIEIQSVEEGLDEIMPSSDTIIVPIHQDQEGYVLSSKLRSDCVAHKLQLVIKDGLQAMSVRTCK